MKPTYISVDIETTSNDDDGSICSIALVNCQSLQSFYQVIDLSEGFFGKPKAFEVNGFKPTDLMGPGTASRINVDLVLSGWLPIGAEAMGRGIGYFDMKFIAQDFPESFARFGRRIFDLWGYAKGLAEALAMDPVSLYGGASEYAAKRIRAKGITCDKPGPVFGPHHALYDAWENIFAKEYLDKCASGDRDF